MKTFWADWKAAGKPPIVRGWHPCGSTESRAGAYAKPKHNMIQSFMRICIS